VVLYTASQEGKDTLGVCREEWVSTLHLLIFRRTAGRGGASVNSEVRAETVFKGAKEFSRSAEIAWSAVARELSSWLGDQIPKGWDSVQKDRIKSRCLCSSGVSDNVRVPCQMRNGPPLLAACRRA